VPKSIGILEKGESHPVEFIHGRLEVGEAMSPPLIKAARALANVNGVVIIDSPPGTSCPVIASIKGSDFCILVTEPTPFGLNDLELAVEVVRELGIPSGVVINRSDIGDLAVKQFCERRSIPILMEISEDRQIAEAYSRGVMIIDVIPEYKERFQELYVAIKSISTGITG
jgi:MinD superfamily P-loop ATPase